jgi:glutamine synthetase
MIDGIIKRLRAYDDRTLRHDVQGKPEAMQKLVNSYFHCG